MIKQTFYALLLLLPYLSISAEEFNQQSILHFDGTSTLHDFSGLATSKASRVSWVPATKGGIFTAPIIEFDVAQLTTDHSKRDQKMMKMFDLKNFPRIVGSAKEWRIGEKEKMEAVLLITIEGTQLEIPVIVSDYKEDENGIYFTSHFTLSLKTFGLKRPTSLGVIRVGDEITLKVETILQKTK